MQDYQILHINRFKMKNKTKEETAFIENCRYLNLKHLEQEYNNLIRKADETDMGYAAFMRHVVECEVSAKTERSISYRLESSRLPKPYKLLDDFDFAFQPQLRKKLIMELATLEFLDRHESVLLIGNSGTGKSHIARSLAFLACRKCHKVLYTTCSDMLSDLNRGVYEKTLSTRLRKYVNPSLLVIDEMGHDRLELEVTKEAHLLFKVINERYNQEKSLIFTTNVEEQDWAEFLGDPISTQAILDRVFHHSILVTIKGPSYRVHQGDILRKRYEEEQNSP
jgi:DNA replication protein DnaC